MEDRGGHKQYPDCKDIPRPLPIHISDEQAVALPRIKGEAVFDVFERKISDYKKLKHCSLETNKLLHCRWKSNIIECAGLPRTPFKFPSIRDFHYHNFELKYVPALTPLENRASFRMQMKIGPGVDAYGQLPIPSDMHVCISKTKPKTKQD